MKHLLIFILFALSYQSYGQNWRTVNLHDTTYYNVFDAVTVPKGYVRVVWIDSTIQNVGDSLSYFYKTLRVGADTALECIDTNGFSWLGEKVLRKPDGNEYYFNFLNDSILFKTNAQLNESWILTTDTNGTALWATVINCGTMLIDNITDSIKTVEIQAKSGGTNVPGFFNSKNFILSKNHGFVNTHQLISFPYELIFNETDRIIMKDATGIHKRIDYYVTTQLMDQIDLVSKYTPGNEWQFVRVNSYSFKTLDTTITTDFVVNYVAYTPDSGIATIQRRVYERHYALSELIAQSSKFDIIMEKQVNHPNLQNTIRKTCFPEVKLYPMYLYAKMKYLNDSLYISSAIIDTFCAGRYRYSKGRITYPMIIDDSSCYQFTYNTSIHSSYEVYFKDFYYYNNFVSYGPYPSGYSNYSYYKLGDCVYGSKIVTDGTPEGGIEIDIFPNPASDNLYITSATDHAEYVIFTLQGQVIEKGISRNNSPVKVGHLSKGIYFVKANGKVSKFLKL